jgi:two-component system, NarL family, nitrate/nitrite response regulator NarL
MRKIKVLVVDDNPVFLRAATLTLGALPHLNVVGSSHSGATVLAIAQLEQPQLILMDVNMPGLNGLLTSKLLRAAGITAKIVFVSLADAPEAEARALGVVADGFVAKSHFAEEIQPVIDRLFPYCAAGVSAL